MRSAARSMGGMRGLNSGARRDSKRQGKLAPDAGAQGAGLTSRLPSFREARPQGRPSAGGRWGKIAAVLFEPNSSHNDGVGDSMPGLRLASLRASHRRPAGRALQLSARRTACMRHGFAALRANAITAGAETESAHAPAAGSTAHAGSHSAAHAAAHALAPAGAGSAAHRSSSISPGHKHLAFGGPRAVLTTWRAAWFYLSAFSASSSSMRFRRSFKASSKYDAWPFMASSC